MGLKFYEKVHVFGEEELVQCLTVYVVHVDVLSLNLQSLWWRNGESVRLVVGRYWIRSLARVLLKA